MSARLLPLLILGLAVPASAADLAQLREARSLIAEAAAVERLAQAGGLPAIYADQMRQEAKQELQSARTKAARNSPELVEPITDALHGLDRHDPAALKAIADRLFAVEGSHGRAD